MIIDSHWFALCLSQGPVRLDGVTYYLRNGRVCVRPSHHKKRGKRSEAELATTGRFVEMRKLWTMYRRAVGELPVWRVAARGVGAGQGDTLFHRLNAGCVRGGEGVWAFPAFRFAAGSLDMPVLREAWRERGTVTLEWEVDEDHAGARWSDRVYVGYFYDAEPRVPGLVEASTQRVAGQATVEIPLLEERADAALHLYLFFGNEDGTRFSPSVYAGV